MAETKHTPGPWFVEDRFTDGDNGVLSRDGFQVAEANTFQHRKARNGRLVKREISVEEQMANIALIAAAPELLEALRGLVDQVEHAAAAGFDLTGVIGVGRALSAIAKAEGRAP